MMKPLLLCSSNKCFFLVSARCYFQQLLGFQKSKYRTYFHTAFLSKFKFSSLCVCHLTRPNSFSKQTSRLSFPLHVPSRLCKCLSSWGVLFSTDHPFTWLMVCNSEKYKVANVDLHLPTILRLAYFTMPTINIIQ